MKLKIENGALVITTGIKAEDVAAKGGRIDLKDKKGNDVYTITTNFGCCGSVGSKFFTANAVDSDGCIVFVKPLDKQVDIAEIKKSYKDALISASLYIPNVAKQLAAQNAYYDDVFNSLTSGEDVEPAIDEDEADAVADPAGAAVDQLTE